MERSLGELTTTTTTPSHGESVCMDQAAVRAQQVPECPPVPPRSAAAASHSAVSTSGPPAADLHHASVQRMHVESSVRIVSSNLSIRAIRALRVARQSTAV